MGKHLICGFTTNWSWSYWDQLLILKVLRLELAVYRLLPFLWQVLIISLWCSRIIYRMIEAHRGHRLILWLNVLGIRIRFDILIHEIFI